MNYHADIVWEIDRYLLLLALLLATAVVFYVAFKGLMDFKKERKAATFRRNFQNLALSGKGATSKAFSAILGEATPQEFLEMIRDEKTMWVFPEAFTRELKDYLSVSGKFSEIEKIARDSKNKGRRIQAVISLGYSEDPAALDVIRTLLNDPDEDIAYASMLALGQIKNSGAARLLLDFIGGHVSRGNRVISLLEKFPPSVIEEVMQATRHQSPAVRFWSVKLLSRWKPGHFLREIEVLAGDEAPEVRAAACECLGKMGDRRSRGTLLRCLKDPVWFVRRRAVKALSRILGREGMPEIIGLFEDENWLVRDGVKKAMIHDFDAALPYIEKMIRENGPMIRKDCVEVLEDAGYLTLLFRDLLSQETRVKERAIPLLRDVMNSGAHLGLESSLTGFDEGSRASILREIAKIDENLAEHIHQKIEHQLVEV